MANPLEQHLHDVVNVCWNYAGRNNTWEEHLCNAALGLAGEAGEVADQVKKMLFHTDKGVEYHREKMVHELGDSFFYHIKVMELMGISLEEVLKANKEKLQSRHPELGVVTERFGPGYVK